MILRVPLDSAVVGLGKLQGIGRANVVGGWVGLLYAGGSVFRGSACIPVIAVEWNAQRKLLLWHCFKSVVEIVDGPLPASDRSGHGPSCVLIVGHQADQVDVFGDGGDVVCAAPVSVNPLGKCALPRIARSIRHRSEEPRVWK